MASTLLESFELLALVEQLGPRLEAAERALAQLPDLIDERRWIADARARLPAAAGGELLDRALRLPEIDGRRHERGKLLQGAIADAVERLQAAIVHLGGPRSPLLDVLFHELKVPALRKCAPPELDRFCAELARRLQSSYARRMFAREPYTAMSTAVAALDATVATWRGVFIDPPLDEEGAAPLRAELTAAAQAVEGPLRQARLLAQAALAPCAELLDGLGALTAKARRRGKGEPDPDAHPLLETDPPDPAAPTADERAELAGATLPA